MKKSRRILTAALVALFGIFACTGFLACGGVEVDTSKPSGGKTEITFVPAKDGDCGNDGNIGYYTDGDKFYSDEAGKNELDWEEDILIPATGNHQAATAWQAQNGKHYHNCSVCGKKIESTEADCTPATAWKKGNGKHWHNCSVCDTKIASSEADHDFDWVVDDNPTETQPGKKHEECKDCGETRNLDTEIPAFGAIIHHEYKDSTCGEDGNQEYWEKDGKFYSDAECTQEYDGDPTISATGEHTEEVEWQKEDGKHWKNCKVCGQKIVDTEADHDFDWVVDDNPTETQPGKKHEECKDCGETRNLDTEIPAHGAIIHHEYKDSTCTEDGNQEYWEKDGKFYSDAECTQEYDGDPTIPATGHDFDAGWIEKEATCTEDGIVGHYHCDNCGKDFESDGETELTEDLVIEAQGHEYGEPEWKWEEDEDDGYTVTATFECIHGDDSKPEPAEVNYKDAQHQCTMDREYTASVTFQDKMYTDTKTDILDGQHTFTDGWITGEPESCTEDGVKDHYHCTVCNKDFAQDGSTEIDIVIPKLGHLMEFVEWEWAEDYSEAKAVFDCSRCHDAEHREAAEISSQTIEPTCTEDGKTIYTAKVSYENEDYDDEKEEEGDPATGHSYGDVWTWTKGDDGTYTATVTFVCSECEDTHGPITAKNVTVRIDDETGNKIYATDPVEFDDKQYPGSYVVELDNITLDISRVQQNFYSDTEFNSKNLEVFANYKDGTSEKVTPDSVSTPDMSKEQGKTQVDRDVLVRYKGKEETYTIHIISAGLYNGSELTMNAADTVVNDCHSQTDGHGAFVGGIDVGSTLTFMFGSSVYDTVALRIYGNGNGAGYFEVTISYEGDEGTVTTTERVTLNTGGDDWWTKWEEPFFICYLKVEKGKKYTLVFTAAGERIEANIDYLKIAPANLPTYNGDDSLRLQGDKAEINGGEWQPGTADGIIGNISEGSSFSFTFMSEYDGPVSLLVTLAGGIHKGDYNPVNNAKIRIYVNGKEVIVGGQEVKSNGVLSWDTFAYDIELEAGLNVIEFKVIVGDVTINTQDGEQAVFFNFSNIAIVPVLVYSDEEMTIGGDNAVTSGCSYEPANGIIGGISSGNGSSFSFNVYAEQESSVDLTVNISGGQNHTDDWTGIYGIGTFEVYINGVSAGTFGVGTDGWENWTDIFACTLTLTQGKNTIEFRAIDGWFNFKSLTISPATT